MSMKSLTCRFTALAFALCAPLVLNVEESQAQVFTPTSAVLTCWGDTSFATNPFAPSIFAYDSTLTAAVFPLVTCKNSGSTYLAPDCSPNPITIDSQFGDISFELEHLRLEGSTVKGTALLKALVVKATSSLFIAPESYGDVETAAHVEDVLISPGLLTGITSRAASGTSPQATTAPLATGSLDLDLQCYLTVS